MKEEFDGFQNGKKIKLIFKSKEAESLKQWMAKPNQEKISTQHFVQKFNLISVHEDSIDGRKRDMQCFEMAGSMFLPQGKRFIDSLGKDIAVLPIENRCNGFSIELSQSGASITMPLEGVVLLALGKWGEWEKKRYTKF
jgi:hypothetical protein